MIGGLINRKLKQRDFLQESPGYIIVFAAKGFSFSTDSFETRVAQNIEVQGDFLVVSKARDKRAK